LKSELTVAARRKGYRHFSGLSENKTIDYNNVHFTVENLRRSIFFVPETSDFMNYKIKDEMTMFLPDKQVINFRLNRKKLK